ncbi:MAG: diacylglycerol kinase [Candidatus Moranbacteria bacterium CG_4_10_14_3_um_filter_44_15]|nr:MAG: diacylglycerol kinase [Candidatus Moranbacteria bacterium CG06_land_8_20_14_3_00_43_56]PIV83910.1 MAG: diacylglycerol kinase [Candidatus Moranbacteria bacterium CG17_big_fil_post_rev_8_21_14_2_50_44_12]PIW92931.1 MAG: diacylglycerol kinase [Candidatus Moranbacteria bacterium CG_4_8_14_3_um_filter_43_15]PIX90911.1 MAG: diacylglycerol kinase [Candidatus Moranbacteria bacterium CG_4_10_14_3_um_filter_44_15]PJA86463.1 MAG: diacylglycerol kinase [Candidatus Moranbacteria bacterium CG_4_9_14_
MDNLKKFVKSFRCAFRGLKYVLKNEQNFQMELLIGIFIVILMFVFDIRDWQKVALFLVIFSVLAVELINTILERVVDILKPRVHPYAQLIKDIMAAAVLIASLGAIVIGAIIFYPYIRDLFLQRF